MKPPVASTNLPVPLHAPCTFCRSAAGPALIQQCSTALCAKISAHVSALQSWRSGLLPREARERARCGERIWHGGSGNSLQLPGYRVVINTSGQLKCFCGWVGDSSSRPGKSLMNLEQNKKMCQVYRVNREQKPLQCTLVLGGFCK